MTDVVVRCTIVLAGTRLRRQPDRTSDLVGQWDEHGVLNVSEDHCSFSHDSVEGAKLGITIEATSPDGVRWYVSEALGVRQSDLAWDEMERKLAQYDRG